MTGTDADYMMEALALARAAAGRTGVNPAVGCVIVKAGQVVGRGATADGGRPHAERVALNQAGPMARGADVYVTLEPCAHARPWGNCSGSLAGAKVRRVVIAALDPDPRTNGAGAQALRDAGVIVEVGVLGGEARAVAADFFARHGA